MTNSKNVFLSFLFFTLQHLLLAASRGVIRTQSNIYNEAFFAKVLNDFKLLIIFAKNGPSQMLDLVKIGSWLLAKGLKYWAHFCSQSTN